MRLEFSGETVGRTSIAHIPTTPKNPSWRWDEQKRCAICTCGSNSISEVLIKVEGISFEAAKIRAAEILGRQDLIRNPHRRQTLPAA